MNIQLIKRVGRWSHDVSPYSISFRLTNMRSLVCAEVCLNIY